MQGANVQIVGRVLLAASCGYMNAKILCMRCQPPVVPVTKYSHIS